VGEAIHSVRCKLSPNRTGTAYVGSVMGREVVRSLHGQPTSSKAWGAIAGPLSILVHGVARFVSIVASPLPRERYRHEVLAQQP
jgi:hypothetical protein